MKQEFQHEADEAQGTCSKTHEIDIIKNILPQDQTIKAIKKSQDLISERMPYRLPMNSDERWAIENQKNLNKIKAREQLKIEREK